MEAWPQVFFFFSSRRRHTRFKCDWSSDVCSSDLKDIGLHAPRVPVDSDGQTSGQAQSVLNIDGSGRIGKAMQPMRDGLREVPRAYVPDLYHGPLALPVPTPRSSHGSNAGDVCRCGFEVGNRDGTTQE